MAERKAVNKYYPPDWTPAKGSLNKYHGTHALRERARKLPQGILIIRFEMPYNIWCEGCNNHIGTGVRYNAEKKKVGMYYSTPIYQFRMKCHLCTNHFEMKTDPQNFDYVIVNGARRQERRWDPSENEQIAPEDKETVNKIAQDAMFHLEHGADDVAKSKAVAPSLARLEDFQLRWRDDYSANQVLRQHFRTQKKEILAKESSNQALLTKLSLDIPLVDENPRDVQLAKLLKFASVGDLANKQRERRKNVEQRSWFVSKDSKVVSKQRQHTVSNTETDLKSSLRKSFEKQIVKKMSDIYPGKNEKCNVEEKIKNCEISETSETNTDKSVGKATQSLVSIEYGDTDSN